MFRPLRLEFAGALYHVTARGNAREDIFRDDGDRATFLDLLGREIAQQRWRLYANRSSRWRAVPEYQLHGYQKFRPRRKAPGRKGRCGGC
jgi:hypothetical protein